MKLHLSLISKWFHLTKSYVKKEEYRNITPYWAKRLLLYQNDTLGKRLDDLEIELLCEDLNNANNCMGELNEEISFVIDNWYLSFKPFTTTTLTLGYPSATDTDKIITFEHKGIEIRTGNPEWGAEPNKLYFVIMHGAILA